MNSKRLATAGALAAMLGSISLPATPVEAATTNTQAASCVDGGGARWTVKSVWGAEVGNAAGFKVVENDATGFTNTGAAATTVDYSVKTFNGSGKLLQTLSEQDRAFSFSGGKQYLNRNPRNAPSAPG